MEAVPVELAKSEVYLVLNASQYSLISSTGYKDSGVIYFMPNLVPDAFSLIAQEGENKLKIVRGIYTYEPDNSKLTLCFNLPEKERPSEFF